MTSTTPNYGLILYGTSVEDEAKTFLDYRTDMNGVAASNMSTIDTEIKARADDIATLQLTKGAIPVPASYSSPNNFTATTTPSSLITTYQTNMMILVKLNQSSNGVVNLNINSLGAKELVKVAGTGSTVSLVGAELLANKYYLFVYNGTAWVLIGQVEQLDGWWAADETWTYASASTFTVSGDVRNKYPIGTKIRFTQTTVKYAYVVASSYSAPNTTLTVTGGSDYTVANAAITSPYYSYADVPQGFPQWFNYVPSWTGLTLGNATMDAKFKISNREVTCRIYVMYGSTSSIASNPVFSLPVTSADNFGSVFVVGTAGLKDEGAATIPAVPVFSDANSCVIYSLIAYGSYSRFASIDATTPFTWTTTDKLSAHIRYRI